LELLRTLKQARPGREPGNKLLSKPYGLCDG
jgi:hypothetical protein